MTESLAQIALQELTRRVEQGEAALRARTRSAAQVQHALRPWAAIAVWFHADVSALLSPSPGVEPGEKVCWLDFCPPRERGDDALRRLAQECRRAYLAALARAEATAPAHPEQRASACRRAANLARLDLHLSIAAGLPAYQPEPKPAAQAAA